MPKKKLLQKSESKLEYGFSRFLAYSCVLGTLSSAFSGSLGTTVKSAQQIKNVPIVFGVLAGVIGVSSSPEWPAEGYYSPRHHYEKVKKLRLKIRKELPKI